MALKTTKRKKMTISSSSSYQTRSTSLNPEATSSNKRKREDTSTLAEKVSIIDSDQAIHFAFLNVERAKQDDEIKSLRGGLFALNQENKKLKNSITHLSTVVHSQGEEIENLTKIVYIMTKQASAVLEKINKEFRLSKEAIQELDQRTKR